MTTDFTYGGKQILTSGPIKPNGKDMPDDVRTRVDSYADIASIPNPYVGLKITVKVDETNDNKMTDYIVKSLKANSNGMANMLIDEVVRYVDYLGINGQSVDTNNFATKEELGLKADKTELHSHINKTVLDGIASTNVDNWNNKVDKVEGKTLTTNDYTNEEKQTVASLKATVGDTSSGLVKDVKDLKTNGISQDNINVAIENYLTEHPVQSGATTEQAAQIEANKTAIGDSNSGLIKEVNDIKNTELENLNTAIQTLETVVGVDETLGDKSGLPEGDANIIASINRIDRKTGSGSGLTDEQINKLNSIDSKVDKIPGKQLSTEDYTSQEKADLANLKTIVGDNNSGLVKDVADLKNNSSGGTGSAGISPEQLEQINTNKTNISAIQTSLNKKANSADVYNKTQIDTKISDIQSGNLVLSDSVQQDTSVVAPYEEDEIYGNILASDNILYSLDTSVTSVGFKLSKAPREGQTIKLEVNNDEIIIDKTELYFDKNSFNEYQFVNISFRENNLNSGNILGYIKAYNNNYNNVYVSIKAKTRNIVSSPIEVTNIVINNFVQDLEIGEKRPLSYTITPENASNKGVSFSSSSSTIATVDEFGIITGIAEGEVTITATTNNNKTSTYKVNVVTNRIEKNNLNIYYDLTKYSEGYSGQVEDLSGNNIVPSITGLNLYTTGRCGFIGNKLMLNGAECKFEIPNNEYILKHPQTIEIYGKFRSIYSGSIQNNNLSLGNLTNQYYSLMNSRINPMGNGYWVRYFTNKGDGYLSINGSPGSLDVYGNFEVSSASKAYDEDMHLVFEFGKAEQKVYLNGNCIYYDTKPVSDFTDATTKTLYLCSENGIGLDLKYFRLYSDMLDAETVRRNYNFIKEGENNGKK